MRKVNKFGLACKVLVFACAALTTLCSVARLRTVRSHAIDMRHLMVVVAPFPEDWERCVGPAQPPERARPECGESEFWYVGFCPRGFQGFQQGIDGAEHDVFRYRGALEAAVSFYFTFPSREFSNRNTVSSWSVPDEWSYTSEVADRSRFACAEFEPFGRGRRLRTCRALSQYGRYISAFSTTLSPEYMTLEDVERILLAIDEKMAFYLGKEME